jgi:hypothetical protein
LLIAAEGISRNDFSNTFVQNRKYLNIIILIGIFKIDLLPLDGFKIVTFDSSKSTVDKVANA